MPAQPDFTEKPHLFTGESIPLPVGMALVNSIGGKLEVLQLEGTKIMVTYKQGSHMTPYVKDLSKGPLTIGRAEDNTVVIRDPKAVISRLHGEISLVEGQITYTHRSEKNPQANPHFNAPKIILPVPQEKKPELILPPEPAFAAKQELRAGDSIPMPPPGMPLLNGWGGELTIIPTKDGKPREDGKTRVEYKLGDKSYHCEKDLSEGPIKIGRLPDNDLVIKGDDLISRCHGQVGLVDGRIMYMHLAKNPQPNPYHKENAAGVAPVAVAEPVAGSAPAAVVEAPVGEIAPELGAIGAGYTHINKRSENQDRGIASTYLAVNDVTAKRALEDMITKEGGLGPTLVKEPGGSTLSMLLKTTDGHFAGATLGDSPIYTILRHNKTGDIKLNQISIPDVMKGGYVLKDPAMEHKLYGAHDFDVLAAEVLAKEKRKNPKFNEKEFNDPGIMHYLGIMTGGGNASTYKPRVFTVDPAKVTPEGYVFRGMLVCSDGVIKGVQSGDVQAALKPLYANDEPTAQAVSKAVVEAALPHAGDNVTAFAVPPYAKAGNMVVIADGNTETAAVAQAAVDMIRKRCVDKPVAAPAAGGLSGAGRYT